MGIIKGALSILIFSMFCMVFGLIVGRIISIVSYETGRILGINRLVEFLLKKLHVIDK